MPCDDKIYVNQQANIRPESRHMRYKSPAYCHLRMPPGIEPGDDLRQGSYRTLCGRNIYDSPYDNLMRKEVRSNDYKYISGIIYQRV